jgi:hypothetical protein
VEEHKLTSLVDRYASEGIDFWLRRKRPQLSRGEQSDIPFMQIALGRTACPVTMGMGQRTQLPPKSFN